MADHPAAAASPPPTADPQDPLPESNWVWRRVFVGLISCALLGLVWYRTETIGEAALTGQAGAVDGLVDLLKLSLYLTGMLMLLYLIAPSAEQAGKWLATISAWKGGVSTASSAKSTAPDGSKAEAHTAAGPAIAGPAQPAAPAAPGSDDELPSYAR